MKTPLSFSNWNIAVGFLMSWGMWWILANTVFVWGWIDIHDGLALTAIFTVVSWIRSYIMAKIYHHNITKEVLHEL